MLPGMLYGHCLRSPHPSAQIVSVDAGKARRLPGVHAVLTGADVPDIRYGRMCRDIPILCRDRVRFAGDKVAAVAAESPEIAEAALALIHVTYEPLPAVFDAEEAMRPNAPLVHAEPGDVLPGATSRVHGDLRMFPSIPNVISQLVIRHGDIDNGFSAAHRIFEHRFQIPTVHQGYLEPHSVVVAIGEDHIVDIWASNKSPHVMRPMLASATGVPEDRLRFNPVWIGGDFGGKGSLMDTVLCYFLARQARRPVKMTMSYFEELTAGNPRHSARISLRTGIDAEARIVAVDAKMVFNAGAYAGFSPVATVHGYVSFAGPYRVPNCAIELLRVYTNTVPAGHMRSPGGPQITFAVESHFDMIANAIGVDPVDFRLQNAIVDGDLSALGEKRRDIRCKEVIEAGACAFNWSAPRPANVGRGVALYEYPAGTWGKSTISLTLKADGTIALVVGSPETGTGFFSVMRKMAAEHFRVPVHQIEVAQGDTLSTGFEVGASGSRLTATAGQALDAVVTKAKDILEALASERLNCAPADLEPTDDGGYSAFGQTIGLYSLMEWAASRGKAPFTLIGENNPSTVSDVTQFSAQFAEVEVDTETGHVKLRHVATSHDVGTIINAVAHQGQVEGGLIQALGQAMSEHLIVQDGLVVTAHLGEYKLPTIKDIPELTTVNVRARGRGPFDIKAISELTNAALPAAIANAVYDAVGVRLLDLPISAEAVFLGLQGRKLDASTT
jgi:CO/xanthine dehydrogenase Mo-binding subunit